MNVNLCYQEIARVRFSCATQLLDVVFSEIMIRYKGNASDFNVSGI